MGGHIRGIEFITINASWQGTPCKKNLAVAVQALELHGV
jgi:hypothetical protein